MSKHDQSKQIFAKSETEKFDEPKKSEPIFFLTDHKSPIEENNAISKEQLAYPDEHHIELNYDSKLDGVEMRHRPPPLEPLNEFRTVLEPNREPSEKCCLKLHRNRRQTGSISAG